MIASNAKRIVLTGVSRGLGFALTERFVELGHHVSGCARSKTAVAAMRKRFGAPHRFATVDVTNDVAVRRWARSTQAAHGDIDLLINNAGMMGRRAPLWEVTAREFAEVVDVNLTGVANVIRHFDRCRCQSDILSFGSARKRRFAWHPNCIWSIGSGQATGPWDANLQ